MLPNVSYLLIKVRHLSYLFRKFTHCIISVNKTHPNSNPISRSSIAAARAASPGRGSPYRDQDETILPLTSPGGVPSTVHPGGGGEQCTGKINDDRGPNSTLEVTTEKAVSHNDPTLHMYNTTKRINPTQVRTTTCD